MPRPRKPHGPSSNDPISYFQICPVYKLDKSSIKDISINDGLHYQGIALAPPVSRFHSTLDDHFHQEQNKYINDKLVRIDVQPITWDPDQKSLKRGLAYDEDIIILPRAISELPSKRDRFPLSK